MRAFLGNGWLSCTALLLTFAAPASAAPMITTPFAFTENFGPNTAGFATGHILQLGGFVDDPLGVPGNIASATATLLPAGPTTVLPFQNIGSIFSGLYNSLTPYAGETGQWEIRIENLQSEVATANTNILDDVHAIPLATNLTVSGPLLAPLIAWDPVLFDDDNMSASPDVEVDQYRIRLLDSATNQFFRSGPIVGNSFQVPAGLIVPGVTHIRLEARDFDNNALENQSSTFVQFFAVPAPATLVLFSVGLLGVAMARRGSTSASTA